MGTLNYLRFLGLVVLQIKISHTPKATIKPGQGFFILNAAKKPKVAITQVMKNKITVLIVNQIYVLKSKRIT